MDPIRIRPSALRRSYEGDFPGLKADPSWVITSPTTSRYNCFSWAAREEERNWSPTGDFWPSGCARELTIPAFVAAYATMGYTPGETDRSPKDVERIALFAMNEAPSHAARQLEGGEWTSKIGENHDITHCLKALCGDIYGEIVLILERVRSH